METEGFDYDDCCDGDKQDQQTVFDERRAFIVKKQCEEVQPYYQQGGYQRGT